MELPNYHSYPSYLVTFDQKLPYIEPYLPQEPQGGPDTELGGVLRDLEQGVPEQVLQGVDLLLGLLVYLHPC